MRISAPLKLLSAGMIVAALAGCAKRGDIASSGEGIIQFRSSCPIVAIPAYAGDVTLFDPADSRASTAIDLTASVSNLKSTCETVNGEIVSKAQFMVSALRRDPSAAREIELPYFSAVVRGGSEVVAKRKGVIKLQFAEGELRAAAWGTATSSVNKADATLPSDIEQLINKPRKAGEADAAVDPLSQPRVKEAVQRSSFEQLIGFNLTQDQLRYNITR